MHHKFLQTLITVIFLLSACAPAAVATEASIPRITTATSSPIPTNTSTSIPTETPTPSITPLPTIPTFTPTFDVRTIVTITPAPKAECPKELPGLIYDTQKLEGSVSDINRQFIDYTLGFLNNGGAIHSIREQFANPDENMRNKDLTGDGVDELIFAYGIWVDIFGCVSGDFQLLSILTTEAAQISKIITATDIDLDGLTEIIVYFDACLGGRCPSIGVYKWDGKQFQNLIENPYSMVEGCSYMAIAPFHVEIQDSDNNGTSEIILRNAGNPWPDDLAFPYRKETRICIWNGKNIVMYKSDFDKPHYRFQALQDGDKALLAGGYSKALDFYQQTIFNEKLEWITLEKRLYDFWVYHSNYFRFLGEPTPTTSPSLQPDPAEYHRLAAYSYYRIMLLYLVQENESDAGPVYNTLQEKFGSDPYGQPYVEMATAFWNAYQSTHKMYAGCAAAIQYAAEHPEILEPLGSDDHGLQSHTYVPADVCPFR